jgi:hypothetical protein
MPRVSKEEQEYRYGYKEGKRIAKALEKQYRQAIKEMKKDKISADFLEGVRDAVNDKTLAW